jgi:uncharacterized protein YdaU (DUF1376 family)
MHSYQHNIKTFNNATRHLTRVERSLYRDAIELYYDEEKPITSDFNKLCRVLIAVTDEEKEALKYVLDSFFTLSNGFYMHKYCEEVIDKYAGNTNAKSMAGKASAAARRAKFDAKINGCSTGDEQVLNEIQLTINQETNKPRNQETINQEPKQTKGAKAPAKKTLKPAFVLPDWFAESDVENWETWGSTPKRRNATHAQMSAAIRKLSRWRDAGLDWQKSLEDAAVAGWQGLFEPKIDGRGVGGQRGIFNKAQAIQDANNAVVAQMFGDE